MLRLSQAVSRQVSEESVSLVSWVNVLRLGQAVSRQVSEESVSLVS